MRPGATHSAHCAHRRINNKYPNMRAHLVDGLDALADPVALLALRDVHVLRGGNGQRGVCTTALLPGPVAQPHRASHAFKQQLPTGYRDFSFVSAPVTANRASHSFLMMKARWGIV